MAQTLLVKEGLTDDPRAGELCHRNNLDSRYTNRLCTTAA